MTRPLQALYFVIMLTSLSLILTMTSNISTNNDLETLDSTYRHIIFLQDTTIKYQDTTIINLKRAIQSQNETIELLENELARK